MLEFRPPDRFSRTGAFISIVGVILITLSLFLPFYLRTLLANPRPFSVAVLPTIQQALQDVKDEGIGRSFATGAIYEPIILMAPYFMAEVILILNGFALFKRLSRFFLGFYMFVLIVNGFAFLPFLLVILLGIPLWGFYVMAVGFICMCIGFICICIGYSINKNSVYVSTH